MSKHTPGPWVIVGHPYYHFQIHGVGRDGQGSERVCMTTDTVLNDAPPDVREANARLIASAPKLLEVCKRIKAHGTVSAEWIDSLDAAISKAEGHANNTD